MSTDRPDFRVDGLVPAEVVRVPHAKPLDRAAQRLGPLDALGWQRVRIALVGPGAHGEHQRGVGHRAGHRADVRQIPGSTRRIGRDAPPRGLEPEDAGKRGRDADRATAVGADVEWPEASRGRSRGPTARAAGGTVQRPGIACRAEEQIVRDTHPAERRRVGLAEHDAAGRLEALDHRRIFGRHVVAVKRRTERCANSLRDDEVLHRERHAVQWPEARALPTERPLGGLGVTPRGVGRDGDVGVDPRVDLFDPGEHGAQRMD